ncbi:MAG: MBOAT family protein [Selenomonas ruminantium]|jgi:alginate O-acetyltransferase complex protein AlgI|uniref:MBOAT family protein n=1 Tax=Selenomonas ruminantium TaxID=971 RepID=A0A927ZQ98_SELRU|nr:MBOAT family protein [Selenomonas ruminantium]MBE6084914.1 MBOAT family protein [Selenomonas ruminantium]
MLFNSYGFILLYLPVTVVIFFLLGKWRNKQWAIGWLVLSSFAFYGYWDVWYVPLLFGSICFNYMIGGALEQHNGQKIWLAVGITVNICLLGYFKYTDFFLGTVNELAGENLFDLPHIVLPLGISFFTFTQTAYLVDAYRGEAKNRSFLTYCEFVTIFPHLIAGPIINHKKMIPQFVAVETFALNYRNMALGITIFAMGLAKKVLVADRIAPWVNEVFIHIDTITFWQAWVGALGYTFQLYFDFSGYSEMAIGLGLMINLRLPLNFNSPYQANNIIDFWRRWHMTLGDWVKNYLYIPLGGNRHGELKKMRNLFASMVIIGLWHGAGWTFVLWGALHGFYLMINHGLRRLKTKIPTFVSRGGTFLAIVIAWVFFRAESIGDGWQVLLAMTDWAGHGKMPGQKMLWLVIIGAVLMAAPHPIELVMRTKFPSIKWEVATIVLLVAGILYITVDSPFLYFQF